ncbi:MAG TPA: PadR family transcriptional regulator, partial [Clostridia bacterium]|nr:PadR family transcriptional regulator [Clostridia bacterium]
ILQGRFVMSLKHGILGLLNYGSMTGYELNKAFKDSLSFFWQAQTSQIYRELSTMEHNGWLTSERIIQDEKPNKRVYSLTDSGKIELENWILSPGTDIRDAMSVRSAFLMRVFFAGEASDSEALSMLCAFRQQCRESILALGSVQGSIEHYGVTVEQTDRRTKYWKIAALFGETYYHAAMEWAEKAIAILVERI